MNPFENIPLTYHVKDQNDIEIEKISNGIWICKPGENSNRGRGIKIARNLSEVRREIEEMEHRHTIIIQKYIENPMLIDERKFDIRCYLLIVTYNAITKGYWYEHGYIRTTSEKYSLSDENMMVHLTNDAIQKNGKDYGKY